uniref:HMA domain-containing protein n=1 Tax=Strongyloides venezuelensis TaxID=75913 RepID=A0A0K0G5U1_STRVS
MTKCDIMAQFKVISEKKIRCFHCKNKLSKILGNLKLYIDSKRKMTSAGKVISKVYERKIEKKNSEFQKFDQF